MSSFKKNYIGIIANSTSPENRIELEQELGPPFNGHFKALEFSYKHLKGGIIPLDIQPQEMLGLQGMKKSIKALFSAVDYLVLQGANIICLTASTKRLAGKSGKSLKEKYPDVLFTIGDNATAISFLGLIKKALNFSSFNKEVDSVFCLGSGFLGSYAVEYLLSQDFKNIVVLSNYQQKFSSKVRMIDCIDDVDTSVKLMLSCTHNHSLKPGSLNFLEPNSVIVDVAVPSGVNLELYNSLEFNVLRFDAGDYYLKNLEHSFCSSILSIPVKGLWYGCFTEAVVLSLALDDKLDLSNFDFFDINQRNQDIIKYYLQKEEIQIPLINFYKPGSDLSLISV